MKSFFLSKKKVLKLKILYNVKTFLTSFQIIIYFYFLYEKISYNLGNDVYQYKYGSRSAIFL